MNRLTIKECYRYEDFVFSFRNKLITLSEINDSIYKKLKLFEDIGEELGIDLAILFKALRDGVFINDNGSVFKDYIKSIEHWPDCWGFISNDEDIEVFFEDYGVTWALTSEELELKEEE